MMKKYRIEYTNHLGYLDNLTVRALNMHEAVMDFKYHLFMHTLMTEQEREQCRIIQVTELGENE